MKKYVQKILNAQYERWGMCNVFVAFEPLAGKRMVEVTERRTKGELGSFYVQN